MKLTNDDIKNYTTGALRFQEDGSPVRMTETQDEKFSKYNSNFHIRCYNTAGIRIKFLTDGDILCFDIKTPGRYGIMQGDIPIFSEFYPADDKDFPKHITLTLEGEGEKAVEFVFPNYQNGLFSDIEVKNATYIKKYEYKRKFLFYGDSITQGMSADRPFYNYASAVSRFFDAEIFNQAISGSYFLPETLEEIPFEPDTVFIAYGTNDFRLVSGRDTVFDRCERYLKKIKEMYKDKKVFVITPLWRAEKDEIFAAGSLADIRKHIEKTALSLGFNVIDGFSLVPHRPEFFADLRLHPNNAGFSFYSQNLIKQIYKMM